MAVSGQHVLIVEDDASMRGSMERLLGTSGFSVLGYDSAEAVLNSGIPMDASCIVSDLKLPGMSGLDLLAEVRARGCTAPLILITAYDAPGRIDEALRGGAAAYLVKPFHGTTLLDVIRVAIEQTEVS
jgi:two-component system response regulator FixJ